MLQLLERTRRGVGQDMSATDTYIRSDAVVSSLIGGETLVVPMRGDVGDSASIYSFNEVGTMIWQALASPTSLEGLVDSVEGEYQENRDQGLQECGPLLVAHALGRPDRDCECS